MIPSISSDDSPLIAFLSAFISVDLLEGFRGYAKSRHEYGDKI